MSKYNFEFQKPVVTILSSGTIYFPKQLVEQYELNKPIWRFAEDVKAQVLAIFRDRGGKHKVNEKHLMFASKKTARKYAGKYTLEQDDGALIFVPLEGGQCQ